MSRLVRWARARCERPGSEEAQTLILAAILFPVLLLFLGLAIEGGRVMVQYRRMQTAADMAALTAAQKLPCSLSSPTCDAAALKDACNYAQSNGFSNNAINCANATDPAVQAFVPPQSCSPYNFIDYGNKTANAQCANGAVAPDHTYVEVQIKQPLHIAIFNLDITLSSHAVARQGVGSLGGFAVYALDGGGSITGNVNTVGATFSNGTTSGITACTGGLFGVGSTGGTTYSGGTPQFSPPPFCGGTPDGAANAHNGLPGLPDPYAASTPPPTLSLSYPNCTACTQAGWQYDIANQAWTQGGTIGGGTGKGGGPLEVFPGVYDGMQTCNKCVVYFNPGVYTLKGAYDSQHGIFCVFGSPACPGNNASLNSNNCAMGGSTGTVQAGQPAADQYMYGCSPWGHWDPTSLPGRDDPSRSSICPTCAPMFYDQATAANSAVPLNGVTFYLPPGSTGITLHGNGASPQNNMGEFLAAPNPCPGVGTFSSAGKTVTFPSGAKGAYYTYDSTSLPFARGVTTQPSPNTNSLYPIMDYSLAAEAACTPNTLMDWPNQFGVGITQGQHLHFLFWSREPNAGVTCSGNDDPKWYGIVYNPDSSWSVTGACGKKTTTPWVTGQVVTKSISAGGSSTVGVSYRPCTSGAVCGVGPGTQLIQ